MTFDFRNLFFRTASLIDNGIEPIYVLEGKAPELKAKVMAKRKEARFGPSQTISKDNTRSRYKFVQKECTELLNCLGVSTVESSGEAEAACAALNQQGIVEGCVTIDGDTFLYGAKSVYRNLSTDTSHFLYQDYSMNLIESKLELSRDKLIVMAVLLGCDYLPDGVPGVGKDSVLRVLSTWKNGKAIEMFKSWLQPVAEYETAPPRPAHCSQCKHPGSLRTHAKSGCIYCHEPSGCKQSQDSCHCVWHKNEVSYEELNIRNKVNQVVQNINAEEIFDEFLNGANQDRIGMTIRPWRMPNIEEFVNLATKKLKWEIGYAVEKILPMLSRWVIIHTSKCREPPLIVPVGLLKKRIKRGCPSYEVQWKFVKELQDFPSEFQTLEPLFLIEREFPGLIPQPVPKPIKKLRKLKQKKLNQKEEITDIQSMFQEMNLKQSTVANELEETVLSDGSDDSDLSFIVHMICERKKGKPTKTTKTTDIDQPADFPPMTTATAKNCPVGNFSLNFSLGRFEHSECFLPVGEDISKEIPSTPVKNSFESIDDSFSTPLPLAERFSQFDC